MEEELSKIVVNLINSLILKAIGIQEASIFVYELDSDQKYHLAQRMDCLHGIPAYTLQEIILIAEKIGIDLDISQRLSTLADPNYWARRIIECKKN